MVFIGAALAEVSTAARFAGTGEPRDVASDCLERLPEATSPVWARRSTPGDQTLFQEEVAPASSRPPNRWRHAHRTVAVLFNPPSRRAVKQTQKQHLATSTRTFHRHAPWNSLVRDQINRIVPRAFWR